MKSSASHILLWIAAIRTVSAACNKDNCLRALVSAGTSASTFCATYTKTANTATTALPTYATACSNLPSRVSSACSCLATATTLTTTTTTTIPTTTTPGGNPATCSPSTIIDIQVRNGWFDQIAIPTVGGTRPDMPPWYYRNLRNVTGDFKREDYAVAPYNPYGVAAFHFVGQPSGVAYASGTLSNPITFCSGTTYALTFAARNAAQLTQSCSLVVSLQNSGLIISYPGGYFTTQFQEFGPVTFRPLRYPQNGEPTNSDGTYNDVLDFTISCQGIPLQPVPAEGLFEIDEVSAKVNTSPIP